MNRTNLVLNPFADLIITKLEVVKCDELFPGRSYIPVSARRTHSLLYLLEGTLKYKRHEEEFIIKPDTIFFLEKGAIDCSSSQDVMPAKYIYINFDATQNDGCFLLRTKSYFSATAQRYLPVFKTLLLLWNKKQPGHLIQCREYMYQILSDLFQESIKESNSFRTYCRISPGITFLEQNYGDPNVTVKDVAIICNMSVGTLTKLFQSLYGIPPKKYLQTIRIKNAKNMLLNATNRIGEIAFSCGYSDVFGFSRAFKRETGFSPTQWINKAAITDETVKN